MPRKRVLTVGHCDFDHGNLRRMLQQHFDVDVVAAATATEGLGHLQKDRFALVLVNRIFDADGFEGLDLIEHVKSHESLKDTAVMLITNYPEHQERAVAAGAARGFGKAEQTRPETIELLRNHLGD